MNNKGQTILSEYVMIFFVVIAAAVAMTVFVQRGLEARIHDARNFMITTVTNSGACDANCLNAAGAPVIEFLMSTSLITRKCLRILGRMNKKLQGQQQVTRRSWGPYTSSLQSR